MKYFVPILIFVFLSVFENSPPEDQKNKSSERPNIVFILADDHRYDYLGFLDKIPELETPNIDFLAENGVVSKNAMVTTSLCSPSRASILTGLYMHNHGIIDNKSPLSDTLRFFPELLQEVGYNTAFLGKWHMGGHDDSPKKGFDKWVSFKGQGKYYSPLLNIDGERVQYSDSSYLTDILTDLSLEFLQEQKGNENPFFLYLSHWGVHSPFEPAKRHENKYGDAQVVYPKSFSGDQKYLHAGYNYELVPRWVKEQRKSWHGVDSLYHGRISFEEVYKQYAETLLSVDESVGRVYKFLYENNLIDNTIIIYMGDNGYQMGEHGLIDKRTAYEASIRVPLIISGPGIRKETVDDMLLNIDIAPTILSLAKKEIPQYYDGKSFKEILYTDQATTHRDTMYYEYYWERIFPQTPTIHAIRTKKWKYVRYHGIWDLNELYDLENDPEELNNLIKNKEHQEVAKNLNTALLNWMYKSEGNAIPVRKDRNQHFNWKTKGTY
ncbi:sulfatase family protein [Marinigracilibium pacificum]|uniref:Sulfatase n=1 Tax=Marinigracilibium pacificum TaxID=2729599 RepID=A0A848J1J8_9BACT|nr:sulfatase [Marinigracilibium pacificum]NMM48354.1 sulfatase [Marinigracilibium pacificum]